MPKANGDDPGLIDYAKGELIGDATDHELIQELQTRGHRVDLKPRAGEGYKRIEVPPEVDSARFGVVSDTHLGSRHQQLSHLLSFYEWAEEQGAEFVLHGGDIVDGLHKVHRGAMVYEQFVHGFDAQTDYAAEKYPDNLPTKMINGNHDMWFFTDSGSSVGKRLDELRPDIEYIGDEGAYFDIGPVNVYLMHPAGGPAYARSYRLQKWIEQVPPNRKPHVVLMGNWHISCIMPSYRNVTGALIPCFQAQTPYERRKGLSPEIGGYVVDLAWDKDGVISATFASRFYRKPVPDDY